MQTILNQIEKRDIKINPIREVKDEQSGRLYYRFSSGTFRGAVFEKRIKTRKASQFPERLSLRFGTDLLSHVLPQYHRLWWA